MSVQTICVSLDENNNLICTGEGGFCGEHNAQLLEITLSGEFVSGGYDYLRLAFDTGGLRGTSLSNTITDSGDSPVYRVDNIIYCPLVQGLTASGSLKIQLCAYSSTDGETTEIKKSGILELTFRPSIMAQTAYEDIGAGLAEKVEAALSLLSALSTEVAFLRDNAVTELSAGNYVTVTDGEIGVNYADIINSTTQALVTAKGLRTYTDDAINSCISRNSNLLTAVIIAAVVGSADSNCMGIFTDTGEMMIMSAKTSGCIEEMVYGDDCADKYILLVPITDIEETTLLIETSDYFAGNIYKVKGDSAICTEVITEIEPSGFAALLSAAV